MGGSSGDKSELKRRPEGAPGQAASFRGNYSHSVDDKGRLSVPAPFRQQLEAGGESRVVITNYISDGARCLEGFGVREWEQFESKLRSKSRFDPKLQKLENFYLSRASECALDRSGRILLPVHLRSYASIDKEVTFTSSIHGFRIWNTKVWEMVFASAEAALLEDPAVFADVDL